MTLIKNPQTFPDKEAHFLIDGPAGQLEVLTTLPETQPMGVGVICHPHPLHQGTMNNKVVHTLSKAFAKKDLATVRFNYRGVGQSEGTFGNSIGEVADLMAVLQWVDKVLDKPTLWLAGFSFGAYIAAMGATQHACQQLYSIAPAVNHQPYDELPAITCPWVIIQGEQDEVISPQVVYDWYAHHAQPNMQLFKMPETSHFFHGHLITLRETVENHLVTPA
ncbi:alpha/beta family hydrolase [Candidatus Berkiella aquae]|uniref:Alpha/beta hydrolase n=1 Tax=Candidatus Berkiella aquae TaxID=295108 RepID=A0A0Q9YUX7_9GAMM|nr:alpha/beta family hydrolase [Candidatus Berkiella aquae]MCS5710741.1 alpha/beta hydrolase [Candidatus Berkiella aquae]